MLAYIISVIIITCTQGLANEKVSSDTCLSDRELIENSALSPNTDACSVYGQLQIRLFAHERLPITNIRDFLNDPYFISKYVLANEIEFSNLNIEYISKAEIDLLILANLLFNKPIRNDEHLRQMLYRYFNHLYVSAFLNPNYKVFSPKFETTIRQFLFSNGYEFPRSMPLTTFLKCFVSMDIPSVNLELTISAIEAGKCKQQWSRNND